MRLEGNFPKEWLSPRRVRANVLNGIRRYGKWLVEGYLKKTIETWEHKADVSFDVKARYAGGNASVTITPSDQHNNAWNFLDGGTDVRYVMVSPDFEPKTYPHEFASYPGAGDVMFTGKPQPGIIPRGWSDDIETVLDSGGFGEYIFAVADMAFNIAE